MKIGLIVRAMNVSGGGERQAIMLAKTLSELGHQATIYTTIFDQGNCFPKETASLKVVSLPEAVFRLWERDRRSKRGISFLQHENILAKAQSQIIDPETVVLNPNDNWGCHVAHYFKKRHKRAISVLMLNDLDTARWTLFDDKMFGRNKNYLKWPLYYLKDLFERYFLLSQDKIMVLNDRTVGLVNKYLKRQAQTIRTGVDTDMFSFNQRHLPKTGDPITLLSHGIFFVHRRYEDTIQAAKLLKDQGWNIRFKIIGDYGRKETARAYYQKLVNLVSELNLSEQVSFVGRVSDEDLVKSFKEAGVFVSAAHMQTWGLAPFEALATGLPVAISETIGAAEVLKDGETAVTFKPGNPEDQARVISNLLRDPISYEAISLKGNNFVRASITRKKYGQEMLGVFNELVKQKQP